jgi:hypothetical protein
MPHQVFISHSSQDKGIADKVVAYLEGRGMTCWIAPRDIAPGADWTESIIDAIDGARVFILILSGHSNDSSHVQREVASAGDRKRAILPMRVQDVRLCKSLEYYLRLSHWFDAHLGPIEQHLARLADDVARILDGPATGVAESTAGLLDRHEGGLASAPESPPPVVAADRPTRADALSLAVDGRRIHVIARRRVTCGRSRQNDVCLRFLPRSPDHDEGSREISRSHMSLDLTDAGLVLGDESAKGVDIDSDPVKKSMTLTHDDAHVSLQIDLPSRLSATRTLEMDFTIFSCDPLNGSRDVPPDRDDACLAAIGEPASRLWQTACRSGIEAARIRRLNNLVDEEYVMLYRYATIGRSARDHVVVVPAMGVDADDLRLIHAGRMFWLHSGGSLRLAVDGRPIAGECLVQLAVGQTLTIGAATLLVEKFAQMELDDDADPPSTPTPAPDSPPVA